MEGGQQAPRTDQTREKVGSWLNKGNPVSMQRRCWGERPSVPGCWEESGGALVPRCTKVPRMKRIIQRGLREATGLPAAGGLLFHPG